MTDQPSLQELLNQIKTAQKVDIGDPRMTALGLGKSTFTQSGSAVTGLTFYDLEVGAKFLYPVLTPLRNSVPRTSGKGGIQANWAAVTAINSNGLRIGVSVGNRGGVQAVTTQNYSASYKGIGLESNVDFEAQYAGMNFDDIRAIAVKTGLEATMIGEEQMILGGNTSAVAMPNIATPVLSTATTGGSLAAATAFSVIVVPLTLDGLINGTIVGGIQGQITRVNADGTTDTFGGGAGKKSANALVTTGAGAANTISGTVAALNGAVGYAWFWGPAGSELLGAITTINSVLITALATGTQTAVSLGTGDNSQNGLAFDGLLYQAFKPGSNSFIYTMATGTAGTGTPLTADGAGGVIEIDIVLKFLWDTLRLGPQIMWVNSQEALNISKKIVQGSATAAQRFIFQASQDNIGGGIMVRTYLNRFSMAGGSTVDIRVHPNMPAGTVFFDTLTLPYPTSNVGNVRQIRTRQEYYQIEWPLRSRKYEYGVYADEVLQHYFPPSMSIITNIANG